MRCLFLLFLCFPMFAHSLTIATWNMQTFFDAETCGTEYREFKGERWTRDAYERRVRSASEALKKIGADVIVLEEVENEGVLFDLFNEYAAGFNAKKIWRYACFASEKGASIGVAVISRFALENVRTHCVDVRTNGAQSSVRPIVEVDVKAGKRTVTVFANHWKSKLGGGENIRRAQEQSLSFAFGRRIHSGGAAVACGDFNSDLAQFLRDESGEKIVLRGKTDCTSVFSAWDFAHADGGSYAFKGKWERIDHIFFAGAVELCAFKVLAEPPFIAPNGFPARFSLFSHSGLSDHLPLCATLDFL